MNITRTLAAVAAAGLLLTASACGGDSLEDKGSGGSGGSGGGETVVVGGQNFTESQVLAAIYAEVLEHQGFKVDTKIVTTRDVYIGELSKGNVDIVPDYLAGITDYLNTQENGEDADLVSSNSVDDTLAALKPLAEKNDIAILPPSEATDQNAFFVTQDFADEHDVATLSDLGALGEPITFGAPPDCADRADCAAGLTDLYGIEFSKITDFDFGSAQMKDAVKSGEVVLGETGTTDGTLADLGLVLLEDDKGLQPAQNLTPAVNADFLADHPDLAEVFNELSQALTTDDLAAMNAKVDVERQKPADVAEAFLKDKGLI